MLKSQTNRALSLGLGLLQLFIGLGGVAGGLILSLFPDGSGMGMTTAALANTPFPNFLIPGLVLLTTNGLGNLLGGVATLRRYRYAGEMALALGLFLTLWIIIQVGMIGLNHWLQPLYFVVGLVELWLGRQLRLALSAETVP